MLIQICDVRVSLAGCVVLHDLSLELAERRVAVIGANGSGKSTFVRLLNGLVLPERGRVVVDGLDTRADTRRVRQHVGFVFQNPDNQIVFPMVAEDLAFGLKNTGVPRHEIPGRIREQLARFGVAELEDRPSHSLSGGEKQLVALSAVMVMRPRIVVFDEPTTLLDLRNRNRIQAAIEAMPQPAIVVSHDLDLVAGFDRVLVFESGRIAHEGPPADAIGWYRERQRCG